MKWAFYDYLLLAQLVLFVYKSDIPTASPGNPYSNDVGEYILVNDIVVLYSFFKNNSVNVSSFNDEYIDNQITVCVTNKCHPTPAKVSS